MMPDGRSGLLLDVRIVLVYWTLGVGLLLPSFSGERGGRVTFIRCFAGCAAVATVSFGTPATAFNIAHTRFPSVGWLSPCSLKARRQRCHTESPGSAPSNSSGESVWIP